MNEKGEVTLLSCLLILAMMSIVLLSALELRRSFKLLERRTELFLCVKETKGEFHQFITFMGRSNWAIKNINRLSLVMIFIPGLQGAAANAQKAKKYLIHAQTIKTISYLKILAVLKTKGCPIDPRMFNLPWETKRDVDEALKLKENQWSYQYFSKPYLLTLTINVGAWQGINPSINYLSEEKGAKLSSLLSSR